MAQSSSRSVADFIGRALTTATRVALALAVPLTVGACGGAAHQLPAQNRPAPRASLGSGPPGHIAVVVMENEEYGDIIGTGSTPYINALARRGALAQQMYAIAHPSLPNYLALTSGATHGITDDCTGCSVSGAGLVGQLQRAGISWKAYMEDLPRPCFAGSGVGGYARKHDPFIYYVGVRNDPGACQRIVPYGNLATDESDRQLPRLVWITPNLCHDMHDCDPATGDRFLAGMIPPLLHSLGPRGLLILTWDEGSSDNGCCGVARGGHVVTILAGGLARPGARLRTPVDHYSVLQTIEDLLALPRLAEAGCACTPALAPLLRRRVAPGHAARGAPAVRTL